MSCLLLTILNSSRSKDGEDIFIANDGKGHDGVQGHTMSHISHTGKTIYSSNNITVYMPVAAKGRTECKIALQSDPKEMHTKKCFVLSFKRED